MSSSNVAVATSDAGLASGERARPSSAIPPPAGASLPRLIASLAVVYVIWGSTYLAMRVALEGFPPLLMSGVRYIIAGSALLGFLTARGASLPGWRQWRAAAPIGVLLFVGGNGFVALGEVHIGSGVAAVVVATMPLWMGVFSVAVGERPSAREWLGIALGFAAVAVLASGSDLRADLGATLFLLLAPVAWAAGSLLSRRSPKGPAGLLTMAGAQMLVGGVAALALGLTVGERMTEMPGWRAIAAMAYLVVFGALLGFSAYSWLLRHVRPVLATSYAFVNPLLAVALGAALGGEELGWATLVAGPAITLAVALAVTARSR